MGLLGERRGLLVGVLLAVALVVVLIATGEDATLVIGVTTGSAYGMVALGLVLVYKSSGVFNFVQGEFGTVALYALYLLDLHTNYWLAFLGALVAAALMGFLTERVIVRCLDFGQLLTHGAPDDVRRHPQVVAAYLGEDPDPAAVALEAQLDALVETD